MSYDNPGRYDHCLLRHLNNRRITFFGSYLYPYKETLPITFIPLFRYNRQRSRFLKLTSYLLSILKLLFYALIRRPHIIHIQWIRFWWLDYYWLKLLKAFTAVKIVYTAHNVIPHEPGANEMAQYRKYYHLMDAVVTHAQVSKAELIQKFQLSESRIQVIAHGLLDFECDWDLVARYKEELQVALKTQGKIIFAMLGYQSEYKGSDLIAEVWAKTPQLRESSRLILLILGKNAKIDFSNLAAIENVHIENRFISDEEYCAALKIADVLLLPYRAISQSGVLLSAIKESVPVLISNVGGLPEALEVADIGWNIGEASFHNLQQQLLSLVNQPQQIYQKKDNTKEWDKVKAFYSWDDISRRTGELYGSLQVEQSPDSRARGS